MKKLAPCLGDSKYSSFLQVYNNKAFMIDPLKYKFNQKFLNDKFVSSLGLNSYMLNLIPLHLHLHEIDLTKQFKSQKICFKFNAPLYPYFNETLKRLNLKIDKNID